MSKGNWHNRHGINIEIESEEIYDVLQALAHAKSGNTIDNIVLLNLAERIERKALEESKVDYAITTDDLEIMNTIEKELTPGYEMVRLRSVIARKREEQGM